MNMQCYLRGKQLGSRDTLPFPTTDGRDPIPLPPPRRGVDVERVLQAVDDMSWRIEDLARSMNCLGYFEDDEDGPRAA
ncbi:MAG: hypothetical protein KDA25_06375 [Phycisphaerales bacterium]|nr:hypothetical protein [Phycisphaerales bacterium]